MAWKPETQFSFDGVVYDYVDHMFNLTTLNERRVEVALGQVFLAGFNLTRHAGALSTPAQHVLEVGNVLGHYDECVHDVVDLTEEAAWYQRAQTVRNVSILDVTDEAYDGIVSISTVEHIGFDTPPWDDTLAVGALHHMSTLLSPGGRLLVTAPAGYNPHLDLALSEMWQRPGFTGWEVALFGRDPAEFVWNEDLELRIRPYGIGNQWASSLWIVRYQA